MKQRHGHKEGRSSELANAKERQRRATRRTRRREERREEKVKRTGASPASRQANGRSRTLRKATDGRMRMPSIVPGFTRRRGPARL
jgi:hypothetical protein